MAPDGYFGEGSAIRRVYRERALALAGPRALLMQAAHPLAVSGLLAHSGSLDDPYDRLGRTAEAMSAVTFGSREEADRITRRVRAMHRQVNGALTRAAGPFPAGTPYRADDPELLSGSSTRWSTARSSSIGSTSPPGRGRSVRAVA